MASDHRSMDETIRSENSGEKRPFEDEFELDLTNKKKAKVADNVKKVAEMVLVLATMGKMRGGRKPTAVEVELMAEAREKLVEVCGEFAPKDVFPRDAFGMIIEDLGLNRLRETKLGILPPKMSIAQKLQATKEKMEKSEVFPLHSATYTTKVTEPPRVTSQAVRMFPSSKVDHASISSGSFQHHSTAVHASPISNLRTLPYQLPTSEVRPGGSSVLSSSHLGRHSTASPIERTGMPHLKSDEKLNANSVGNQKASNTPTRTIQSQSTSFDKAGLDKGPTHLTNINHHIQHRMNSVQSSAVGNHNEIGKIVQKVLHPHKPEQRTWTPPSRDYMNKGLTCQTCKVMINEVDTALVCDACERGYHLRCLQCNLKSIFGDEWNEWHCAKCLAISNGKPIPPKYGRVMRNISTPKVSLEKKVQSSNENFNQRLMTENGNSGSQSVSSESVMNNNRATDMQINGTHECGTVKLPSENSEVDEGVKLSNNGLKVDSNKKGEIGKDEEGVDRGNIVKTRESCTTNGENEGSSSSSMHNVEWVGDVTNEVDGNSYYHSCRISGTIYQLQNYALFSSNGNNIMANKLQAMWEDNKTNKKWVTVTRCFFSDDLPKGVGRPCAPESNEVYESNHETTLPAGLIHGPCEVLPPRKYSEEIVMQNRSQTTAGDKLKPIFTCKWFYDEKKQLFRDVTC